jgi:lipoprotein-anchoring transpeptidase ErfK/SrfK
VVLGWSAAVPSADAAKATTKSTTKASSAKGSSSKTAVPAKTTLPPTRTPNKDLVGWETLTEAEWPKALDAVRAQSINSAIRVHQTPDAFSPAITMNKGTSAYGAIAFLALGKRDDYVRVLLPLRPNGSIGWVRASDVTLDRMPYRVVIDVKSNTLTVEGDEGIVVSTKVALGTNNTPTPTGLFYVKEIVPQANPNGGLGPIALGLSGLSEELRSFAGGYGRVAIHGTNAPGKLGGDVSHGCVRMDNPTILRLAKLLPLGTPVEIIADATSVVPDALRLSSSWTAPVKAASGATSTTTPAAGVSTTTIVAPVAVSITVPSTTIAA